MEKKTDLDNTVQAQSPSVQELQLFSLIQQKRAKDVLDNKILTIIRQNYRIVDATTVAYSECATAGHVYSYVAYQLAETVNYTLTRYIKQLLIEQGIKTTHSKGLYWFKGLLPLDPTEDRRVVDRILQQHYKDRAAYRERQRANGLKRNQGKHQ